MHEEAGLVVEALEPIGAYLMSPGGTSEMTHFFCARVDARDAGGLFGLAHEGEDIRAFVVKADAVTALMNSGRIENAAAVIALQWFLLNRSRLRAQ